jgi:hypothetical protein
VGELDDALATRGDRDRQRRQRRESTSQRPHRARGDDVKDGAARIVGAPAQQQRAAHWITSVVK